MNLVPSTDVCYFWCFFIQPNPTISHSFQVLFETRSEGKFFEASATPVNIASPPPRWVLCLCLAKVQICIFGSLDVLPFLVWKPGSKKWIPFRDFLGGILWGLLPNNDEGRRVLLNAYHVQHSGKNLIRPQPEGSNSGCYVLDEEGLAKHGYSFVFCVSYVRHGFD